MICYQGESVWPEGEGYPKLYSIGVALGRIPRFCGHVKEWYPVLGHVFTVARLLPEEFALQGLLHDAPESCMGDVPTPWKTVAARRREDMLLRRIYEGNGLKWPIAHKVQELIDQVDAVALAAEAHVLGHPAAEKYWPEPSRRAIEYTLDSVGRGYEFLNADIAGPLFVRTFEKYKKVQDDANQRKRDTRNAIRRARRANTAGASLDSKVS